jgi:hypothetical protein
MTIAASTTVIGDPMNPTPKRMTKPHRPRGRNS